MPRRLDPERLGQHVDRLYRAAWALCGNREDAEDLVQETYARVLAKPRLLVREDELGYLLRVLRNAFVSSLRARERRPQRGAGVDEATVADRSTRFRPPDAVEMRDVFAAIAALPEDFRDALVAVDVVGLGYREAAATLRIEEGTLTTRLHRARARVIAALDAPGKDAPPAGVHR